MIHDRPRRLSKSRPTRELVAETRVHKSDLVQPHVVVADDAAEVPVDALPGPGEAVDGLQAPVCAPGMAIAEGIEFARSVAAPRTLAIHDKVYSDLALGIVDRHFGRFLGADGLGPPRHRRERAASR